MLVELIGYGVARIVMPFLSLGRVYVEVFSATPEPLRWPGYLRDATGRIELRPDRIATSRCRMDRVRDVPLGAARDHRHVSRHVVLGTA